jgi:hypothetical protein
MDLIPKGSYRAVAVQVNVEGFGPTFVQFGETSKGNPQVVVNFEIIDGDMAGRRHAWWGYFTEATTERTVESLRYCGFKGDDLAGAMTQQLDQEVQIVVDHEEYQGKVRSRIQWVNRGGGGGYKLDKPMDKRSLTAFAARMRASVRSIPDTPGKKGERGTPSAGNGTPPPSDNWSGSSAPPPTDDDIPF